MDVSAVGSGDPLPSMGSWGAFSAVESGVVPYTVRSGMLSWLSQLQVFIPRGTKDKFLSKGSKPAGVARHQCSMGMEMQGTTADLRMRIRKASGRHQDLKAIFLKMLM